LSLVKNISKKDILTPPIDKSWKDLPTKENLEEIK
tara:strand:- start:1047 stop:1151 length:105 start_codon:yes stop_codon:yes gene_type:complete